MADYRAIGDAEVDPDAPVTSSLMYALRDNPLAISQGSAGAPRVQDSGLATSVTQAGRNWVARRITSADWNAVGQTVMGRSSQSASPGIVVPGSAITASSADGVAGSQTLPGSWRCQGTSGLQGGASAVTSWLRVS